jgi:hypothetical protein
VKDSCGSPLRLGSSLVVGAERDPYDLHIGVRHDASTQGGRAAYFDVVAMSAQGKYCGDSTWNQCFHAIKH